MASYVPIPKKEYKKYSPRVLSIIRQAQCGLRKYFKFNPMLVGSTKYRLASTLGNKNEFDFDITLVITKEKNKDKKQLEAIDIRNKILEQLQKLARVHDFHENVDNDTRTLKLKHFTNDVIDFKVELAIYKYIDGQPYINRYDKEKEVCEWQKDSNDIIMLNQEFAKIKKKGLWTEFRNLYFENKNKHHDKNEERKSISVYKETINEIKQKYKFK